MRKDIKFTFDYGRCKQCEICVALCPVQALGWNEDKYPVIVDKNKCVLCGLCEYHCPDFAIRTGSEA